MPNDRRLAKPPSFRGISVYIDDIHYSVRDNGVIHKLAAYAILGINQDGRKEVLTIEVSENVSSNYWLSVLNG